MTLGIVGGGQLGRMLGLAAARLGIDCVFLDPSNNACAGVVGDLLTGAFDDTGALNALAERCDVLTYEFENVDVSELTRLAAKTPLYPGVDAVRVSQSRRAEKTFFAGLGLAVAPWGYAAEPRELDAALAKSGLPAIVKTDRLGYDGKGQRRVRSRDEAHAAFADMGSVAVCVEGLVDFDEEVSVIGARSRDGQLVSYPLTRNRHDNGILVESVAIDSEHPLAGAALHALQATTSALDYVGTLAIEFFVCGDTLLVNEFAPRVHNSGHWTMDGALTSQFENHVRAVAGLPLGSTRALGASGMHNFLGVLPAAPAVLANPAVRLHDYGKAPRPGRKVGHANVICESAQERDKCLNFLAKLSTHTAKDAL